MDLIKRSISKIGLLSIMVIMLLCVDVINSYATHMIGGDITYKCLGNNQYEITLTLYQDCLNGEPQAIEDDDPANYAIYRNTPVPQFFSGNEVYSSRTDIIPTGFSNECITNYPNTCLRRQIFVFQEYLPADNYGYTIVYQRCCRNAVIQNIINPGNIGVTYSATIPPTSTSCANNSAVFKNVPPQIICNANPFSYDFSATDIDGDSLSYELCSAYLGGSPSSATGIRPSGHDISPPPYNSVPYLPPYSAQMPMAGFPPLQISATTGELTITPNTTGRFVVSICVHEWRNGTIINTLSRDVQFIVTNCSKTVVANIPQLSLEQNTYVVECDGFTVDFLNYSSGGFSYVWDFGDGSPVSTDFQPSHTYADTGIYKVKLVVNQGSTCPDSIMRLVKIFPVMKADYSYEGIHCPKEIISFTDLSTATYMPFESWHWDFADGNTSDEQNPKHAFTLGGDYAVSLIATTEKGCVDTAVTTINIDRFEPFAGNDTIIVFGYSYNLNASGGDYYQWSPSQYLDNPNIANPSVTFPDTGRYTFVANISSEADCHGTDTINVWVVKDSGILMPNVFSPNGDGINDFVMPLLIGYTKLNYFRIFNRWGELVYSTETLATKGWDGYQNGQLGDLSTYYWAVSAQNIQGDTEIKKGDLILLR